MRDIWKKELVIDGVPIRRIAMDTSLWFEPDDDIRKWFAARGYLNLEAQHSYIGSITIYVDALCADVFETPLEECADVCIGFWAATTGMSLLFEKSLSIRKAFVEIAKSQDDTICAFKPTDESADVFWFEGEEVEIENQYNNAEEERPLIGCIDIDIYSFCVCYDVVLQDSDDIEINFTAVTTCMSRLFEQSIAIRQAFIEIAKVHEDAICVFDRAGNDVVVWFNDKEAWEEVGDSNTSRALLTERIRQNRADRELQ